MSETSDFGTFGRYAELPADQMTPALEGIGEEKKEKRDGYEIKTHRDWPGKRPDHATDAGRRRKMIKVTAIQTGMGQTTLNRKTSDFGTFGRYTEIPVDQMTLNNGRAT